LSADSPTFDLQSHSLHSDGALPAGEVVAAAADAGVELLALSDHDTVDGVQEALDAASGAGIRVVTAVEISSVDRDQQDLHVLGYVVDHHDAVLRERLHSWRGDREQRADAMAAALRELGYELDASELERRKAEGKTIGRPHLADAVVRHPGNAERLRSEGLDERSAFLEAYLIDGKPAFKPRTKPTVTESIAAIHDAGGVAVWAHPFWDVKDAADVLETIDRFREFALDGVECFYATHTREQAELLADRCAELGLLSTGSSDFHGPDHRLFSKFRAFSTYGREPSLGPIGS
jgi:predicted metal-dependent phosphoesterase TrpH